MDQSYWSISDILADATKIPCHFKIDVPGVAHLRGDPSVQAQQEQASQSSSLSKSSASSRQQYEAEGMITKGTRVELPYWLAEWLVLQDCVDVSLPKVYSQRVRNALNAGPKSVQLRGQANWWYAMGSRLGGLMDSEMIMELLSSTYSARLPTTYTSAQHLASASRGEGGAGGVDIGDGSSRSGGGSSLGGSGGGSGGGKAGFGTSVGMSAEMVDFVNGLEETEKIALKAALDSAAAMRIYLAGKN